MSKADQIFIANIKGKGYGVIYKNKELQGGNL